MKVHFRESFARDIAVLTDDKLLRRIKEAIERVEQARTFQEIPNRKRLESTGKYYRLRVGEHRLGLVFEKGAFVFVRCLGRKEIYCYSP